MKLETIIIQIKRQFALKVVSLACLALCYPAAYAVSFGEVALHSNLGDVLRIQIPLSGASENTLVASCLRPKIETLDGQLIEVPDMEFITSGQSNRTVINLTSKKLMDEPAIKFSIAMICGTTIRRDYTLLLDFPESAAAMHLAPVISDVTRAVPVAQETPQKATIRPLPPKRVPTTAPVADATAPEAPVKVKKEHTSTSRHKEKAGAAAGKDVLRVENNDSASDPDLKMSRMISDTGTATPDQQRSEENRLAQAQFAAIMHGDDPLAAAQNELKREQLKTKNLQNELDKTRQQDLLKDASDKNSSGLLTGLIAGVVVLLAALAGLVFYALRRSRAGSDHTWWDPSADQKKNVTEIVDYLQTSAEEGNLDPAPITSIRDNSASESPANLDPAPTLASKVEPAPKFKRTGLPALEDTNSSTFNFFSNRGQSIHIEEVSDITQEAEFWMSVNDPHRAIEILEPQSRDENPGTPVPWLYLLDLYRLVGDEDNYRDLRQRFKHKFNARVPNFHEEVIPGAVRSFEDFPHLVSNCSALWTTDDIVAYLESLLVDDREGERIGFDLPVYRDILFLLAICHEIRKVQYHPQAKTDEAVTVTAKSVPVLPQLEEHLIVKPGDAESRDNANSLNFDLLDFKVPGENKN